MQNQGTPKHVASDRGRLRGKRPAPQQAPQRVKLLVTIVSRNKAEFYMDLLQSMEVNVQLATSGYGTASTDMLQLLGLADSEKSVIFSFVREDRAREALALLGEKFKTVRGGKGRRPETGSDPEDSEAVGNLRSGADDRWSAGLPVRTPDAAGNVQSLGYLPGNRHRCPAHHQLELPRGSGMHRAGRQFPGSGQRYLFHHHIPVPADAGAAACGLPNEPDRKRQQRLAGIPHRGSGQRQRHCLFLPADLPPEDQASVHAVINSLSAQQPVLLCRFFCIHAAN